MTGQRRSERAGRVFSRPILGLFVVGLLVCGNWLPSHAQSLQTEQTLLVVTSQRAQGPLVADYEKYPLITHNQLAPEVRAPGEGALRWLSVTGKILSANVPAPPSGIRLYPVSPGYSVLRMRAGLRRVAVLEVMATNGQGKERATVALSRGLPAQLQVEQGRDPEVNEEVTYLLRGPAEAMPSVVQLISEGQEGRYADALRDVPLTSIPCEEMSGEARDSHSAPEHGPELMCARTPAIRLAVDVVERNHPATVGHTLVGEVGGTLELQLGENATLLLKIGAPEALSPGGPGRYRVRVRTRILRTFPGGPPAVGADDEDAARIAIVELDAASRMWGQCGISLGPREHFDVEIVDPPQLSLLTVGCDSPLLASGGNVDLKIDGRRLTVRTSPGQTPHAVASRLASALREQGYGVKLFRNAQPEHVALPSFDLVVTSLQGRAVRTGSSRQGSIVAQGSTFVPANAQGGDVFHGRPVNIEAARGNQLSSDPSLGVCKAEVDLADGLEHFNDFNAASGTVEERTLLRALSDDDPTTIELLIVPVFGGLGRIGESFIYSPGGSLQNALILDRTGIQAGARSFTLAHELGHVLLDLPGHPDDYGVDTPTSLMDADAADSTIFGPRRLSLEDCQRALRQNGQNSPLPLIADWPLAAQ